MTKGNWQALAILFGVVALVLAFSKKECVSSTFTAGTVVQTSQPDTAGPILY